MNFDKAFDILQDPQHEGGDRNGGGYVNDPRDPGGETKWGISKRAYPKLDIANLTRDQAKAIYKSDYWGPLPKAVMATPVAFHLFDLAVHSGVRRAIQILQTVVDTTPDGIWGPKSQAAFDRLAPTAVAIALTGERLRYLTYLNTWSAHGRGWVRRLASNLDLIAQEQLS